MMTEEIPIEPHLKITLTSILSTLSDYATTQIGLKYPELRESNPNVDFGKEFLFAEAGGVGVYTLSRLFAFGGDLSLAIGLVIAGLPFGAAVNNLAWIGYAHRKLYPWKECPLLYPEGE